MEDLLQENGVPDYIFVCAQKFQGAVRTISELHGPAPRQPAVSKKREAGDASDWEDAGETRTGCGSSCAPLARHEEHRDNPKEIREVPESQLAVDSAADMPVKLWGSL